MVPPDSPDGSDSKASAYNMGDPGSVPGLGRSPGEGPCALEKKIKFIVLGF